MSNLHEGVSFMEWSSAIKEQLEYADALVVGASLTDFGQWRYTGDQRCGERAYTCITKSQKSLLGTFYYRIICMDGRVHRLHKIL